MAVKKARRARGQMSESMLTAAFLTLSGGAQDAYSYCVRGKVFANAQTGNIVLMSQRLLTGDFPGTLRYLIPLLAFTGGVFVAEQVRAQYQRLQSVHWRQLILLGEIALLLLAGFLPHTQDSLANALVSFSCALQVQTFRKVNGRAYASTMCIGNLRGGVEAFSAWLRTKDRSLLKSAGSYFGVIAIFALGAGLGSVLTVSLGVKTIWVSCALLCVSFALMFPQEERKTNSSPAADGKITVRL